MRNYTKVLKIAPAFLLMGTMMHAQTTDTFAPKEQKIEEVVLIGYGKQKKEDLTGSIASITSKDFNGGSTSPDQLIQGKAPGVTVTGNGGNPGAGSTIRIRGGASLNASNDPLIVIDGIPMDFGGLSGAANALALINPNDIESFDVLKDASAAAIYGNRASNGVILITTKKGSSGKLKVNFSSVASVSTKMGNLDVLSADEFRKFVTDNATSQSFIDKLGTANTNWQDLIYQTAWGTDNNVAISGGIKKLPYRLSLGYNEQNGLVKTNEFRRTSVGLNLTPKFFDNHLSVTANLKGTMTENRFNAGVIGAAQFFDPTQNIYDYSERGNQVNNYWEWWQTDTNINGNATRNPLGSLYGRRDVSTVFRGIAGLQLDYKFHFLPDLHWNINLGYDYQKGNGAVTEYPNYAGVLSANNGGTRRDYTQEKSNKLLETYLNYVKDIDAINTKVDLMAGYSYQQFHNLIPSATTYYGNQSMQPLTSNLREGKLTLLGYYGRAIFTIADRYIITGAIRRDATSRFYNGTDDLSNVWGTFPSVSGAWKIKEEKFLKNSNIFSDLKLRAGWGETGQQEIGDANDPKSWYQSFGSYGFSEQGAYYGFGDQFYFMYRPTQYNPNLTWETTQTVNAGLDFGFWNNRITGSIDWFKKFTKDLLGYVSVPAGEFSNKNWKNIGEMETDGIEFLINVTPVKAENFTWDFSFNVAHYNPVVTNLKDVEQGYTSPAGSAISGGVGNQVQAHTVGYTPFSFYVYQQVYDTNGKPLDGVYVDRNGDGKIDTGDKYFYKSTTPDATFGFSTKFKYKNWDFSTSLRAVIGNYVYNNFASQSNTQSISTNNYLQNISSATASYGFSSPQYWSDIFVEDASFLRMDNLTLGYNFGDVFNKGTSLRVYGMAQNVFVITDYSGVDPEIFGNIDNGFYQRPKVYSLGLNFQF